MRNLLATLLLSTGVPMLTAGDELGRTQRGNNNAYCQDNELSWLDWKDVDEDLRAFVARVLALRRSAPVLRQEAFFEGHELPGTGGTRDLAWFAPDGGQLTTADWFDTGLQTLGMYLDGRGIRHRDAAGPAGGRRLLPGLAARRPGAAHRPAARTRPGPTATSSSSPPSTPPAPPRRRRSSRPGPVELPGRCVWVLKVAPPALTGCRRSATGGHAARAWTSTT